MNQTLAQRALKEAADSLGGSLVEIEEGIERRAPVDLEALAGGTGYALDLIDGLAENDAGRVDAAIAEMDKIRRDVDAQFPRGT